MAEPGGEADTEIVVRAKGTIDGARSLPDAAVKARRFAEELERLAAEGYELTSPVEDDYGFATPGGRPIVADLDEE